MIGGEKKIVLKMGATHENIRLIGGQGGVSVKAAQLDSETKGTCIHKHSVTQ